MLGTLQTRVQNVRAEVSDHGLIDHPLVQHRAVERYAEISQGLYVRTGSNCPFKLDKGKFPHELIAVHDVTLLLISS